MNEPSHERRHEAPSLKTLAVGTLRLDRRYEQLVLAAGQHCASLLADPLDQGARSAAVNSLRQLRPEDTLSCVTSAISKVRHQDGTASLERDTGRKTFEFLTTVYEGIPYPDATSFEMPYDYNHPCTGEYPLKHQLAVLRAEHALELPPELCSRLKASLREALCGPKLQRRDPETGETTIIDSMCQIVDWQWVNTVSKKIREHINEHSTPETPTPTWLVRDKEWLQELHGKYFLADLGDGHYSTRLQFHGARMLARLLIAIDPTLGKASVDDVHRSALAKLPDEVLMQRCALALRAYHQRWHEIPFDRTAPDNDHPFNLVLEVCNARVPTMAARFLQDAPDALQAYYLNKGMNRFRCRRLNQDDVIADMREGKWTSWSTRPGIEGVGRRLSELWTWISSWKSKKD